MPLFNTGGNNKDIVDAIKKLESVQQAVLIAIQGIQFNQPPLLITSPAPFNINFSPGEIKEIIPASSSARRIIIKSVLGECKLLLGTTDNIELSAISVKQDRLIDERWQGAVYGYSENGAEILINIEIESGDEEEMPLPLNIGLWMHTDLEQWFGPELDEAVTINTGIAGHKMWRALSFNPGQEYDFNIAIASDLANDISPADNGSFSTIAMYNIPYESFLLACYSRIIGDMQGGNQYFYEILRLESANQLLAEPGPIKLSFFDTRRIGMISVHTNNGWKVGTLDYSPSTQTFTVVGY
jgi:hypothetical protein